MNNNLPIKMELPDKFLEAEIRCDYEISTKMKKIWAVELDLLNELLQVCKKHSILIFASGGTMLGAVRHKGFIPWDDDIDLMMYREDYNRLCEVAPSEFEYPYFFQTEYTDPGSLRGHAQLRNAMTTAILEKEYDGKWSFNQGVFIDIFPLDAVIDDDVLFSKQKVEAMKYKDLYKKYSRRTTRYYKFGRDFKALYRAFAHRFLFDFFLKKEIEAYHEFEEICQRYNQVDTKMISTLSFQFDNKNLFKYRADYLEFEDMPFEFMTIPVSKNYDNALRQRYGDYLEYVIGGSMHGEVIFDVDYPYKKYLRSNNDKQTHDE